MVITCPNCEAKYKLPGEKLKGRGAKITCPRCSHVFVIFNKEADTEISPGPSTTEEPSEKRRSAPPGPVPPGDGQSAVPGGLRAEDIFTSDYGGKEAPQAPAKASLRAREVEVPDQSPPVEPTSGRERLSTPGFGRLEAEDLDFQSLGIQTWKVKVAIGLIYDFSDIKTLRKSMREKKVTYDDQISPDGVEWERIGSDAELEVYFRELHETKLAEQGKDGQPIATASKKPVAAGPDAKPTDDGKPTATTSVGASTDGLGKDAFKVDLARPRRPRRRQPVAAAPERKILGMKPAVFGIGVVAIAIIGLAITLNGRIFGGNGDNPAIPESRVTDEQLEKIQQAAREQIEADLERQRQELAAEAEENPDVEELDAPSEDGYAHLRSGEPLDTSQLEPVIPEPIEPTPTPPPAAVVEDPPEPTPAPASTATVEETTADDWFLLGEMALGSGNCSGAIPSLEKAVGMASGNLNFNYKLGVAYMACGRNGDAVGPLSKAAPAVPDAQKRLDEIQGGGSE